MKKLITVFAVLLSLVTVLSAQEIKKGSVKAPGKGQIVIVGRMTYATDIDIPSRLMELGFKDKDFKKDTYYTVGDPTLFSLRTSEIDAPFFYTAKVNDKGQVVIPYFNIYFYSDPYSYARVPCGATVTIPEGASYVYVGQFDYQLDYALRPNGFKHYDEYDKAEKWINTATGKNVELYRGEISFD